MLIKTLQSKSVPDDRIDDLAEVLLPIIALQHLFIDTFILYLYCTQADYIASSEYPKAFLYFLRSALSLLKAISFVLLFSEFILFHNFSLYNPAHHLRFPNQRNIHPINLRRNKYLYRITKIMNFLSASNRKMLYELINFK